MTARIAILTPDPAGGAAYAASVLDVAVTPPGTGPERLAEGHGFR